MIRRALQRHFFLLLSAILLFAICVLVGFGIMQTSGDGRLFGAVHAHEHYFLLWRVLVYAAVIFYWPRWIAAVICKRHAHAVNAPLTQSVSRQPIALVCVAFELLIVQNLAGQLLAFVLPGTSG